MVQIVSFPDAPSESRLRAPLERPAAARALPITASIALSARVVTALANAGILTFAQLSAQTDSALLQIPNLGYAALIEIRETLQKLGLAREENFSPAPLDHRRTALESELWNLTAPAGGPVQRGIAMVHFGWDGRLGMEEIRDRYRVRRDLLRSIFLAVETQPPPAPAGVKAIRAATRFLVVHAPRWLENAQELLITSGLARQTVTIDGLLNACRIAGVEPGFELVSTPRLLLVAAGQAEDCRVVVRTVQHLAAMRGTTTVEEVRCCSEKFLGHPVNSKFIRRAIALIDQVHWIDDRIGLVSLRPLRPTPRESVAARPASDLQEAI